MKTCPRCQRLLSEEAVKRNQCPVCEKILDLRRKGEDARVKMKKDERVKRPL